MFVSVDGLAFHLQQSGPPDADAVLLLHSLGTQGAIWDVPAAVLARRYRVLCPDLRGHGLSAVTKGPYVVTELAHDMVGLLDALSIAAVHVAGVSLGGMVAQALAAQAPERVRSLVLVDTALAIPPVQLWQERAALVRAEGMEPLIESVVARWLTAASLHTPEAEGLRTMLRRTDPEGYAAAAEAVAGADLTAAAGNLRVPTLVLVGDEDAATPRASAEALRDAIPGARMEVIPGAAHIPMMEQPERVAALIERFLATVQPTHPAQ
jgi:3-oxoadipate enol-lactonase/4-carboxymuconolactone decarboxylase